MNVVGGYRFAALAYDAEGHAIASLALMPISVVPGDGLHVEFTWLTPGDIDESDTSDPYASGFSAGSDMDLHLLAVLSSHT